MIVHVKKNTIVDLTTHSICLFAKHKDSNSLIYLLSTINMLRCFLQRSLWKLPFSNLCENSVAWKKIYRFHIFLKFQLIYNFDCMREITDIEFLWHGTEIQHFKWEFWLGIWFGHWVSLIKFALLGINYPVIVLLLCSYNFIFIKFLKTFRFILHVLHLKIPLTFIKNNSSFYIITQPELVWFYP